MTPVSPFSCPLDVLVIGSGAAGLYTALCLPPSCRVGLVTKETLSLSASDWAQGGIAAVIDPQDSADLHIQDTLQAGAGLCDRPAVQFLVEHASACIQNLVNLGVGFDRHAGSLALTLEAAHSRRRVLHAADTTGRAVVSTLAAHVVKQDNIQVIQAFTLDLWLDSTDQRCRGVSLLYEHQVFWVEAGAVILATGGGGQVFARTTNPALSTGDGVAIAYRAGAVLRDLEFVQFHPTALTKPGAPRFLISEAVRGEGAHLVDDQGYRFAFDYHPAGELAPRDVVSRAIYNHLQKTSPAPANAHVWLDLRPIPAATIQHRFPNIIQVCQRWGIDVFQEPIPVTPAAHYWMGGIATDLLNRTSIADLYAVGETASTGVHGANRLASNSLLECLVFGAQFRDGLKLRQEGKEEGTGDGGQWTVDRGQGAGGRLPRATFGERSAEPSADGRQEAGDEKVLSWAKSYELQVDGDQTLTLDFVAPEELTYIEELRQELPRLVWQSAGICREATQMEAAIAQVEQWQTEFAQLAMSQALQNLVPGESLSLQLGEVGRSLRTWAETRNLLTVALLILKSADFRAESRGGHFRSDYPETDPAWQVHTLVRQDPLSNSPRLGKAAIDP